MRLSRELIDAIASPQYRDYKKLQGKNFDGEGFGCLLVFVLQLLLIAIFGLIFGFRSLEEWASLYAFGIFVPPCWLPVGWLVNGAGLDDWYHKKYRSRSEQSHAYLRLQHYKQIFPAMSSRIDFLQVSI
jgi:hypothetical protein